MKRFLFFPLTVLALFSTNLFAQDVDLTQEVESAVDSENLFDREIEEVFTSELVYLKVGKSVNYKLELSEDYGYYLAAASFDNVEEIEVNVILYKNGREYDYAYKDGGFINAVVSPYIEKSGIYKVVVEMLKCPENKCPVLFKAYRHE